MPRLAVLAAALLLTAQAAAAQAPPPEVGVTSLAAPDAFSTAGRDTGLPRDLWRGASLKTARTVLPLMSTRPLSPAAAALARRVLAAGAQGPEGVGPDPDLVAARAGGLLAQGDPKAAAELLAHARGADRDPDLARVSAEAALLAGDDARACAVAQGLASGRDDPYWLRLRAYCQAMAGQGAQAQLTFDLAQAQAKDPIFARLMGAKLTGAVKAGPASLRNGLDYALSRNLGLDLAGAKPSPAVAAALSSADPAPLAFDLTAFAADLSSLAQALIAAGPVDDATFTAMFQLAASSDPKPRARGQIAALMVVSLGGPLTAQTRGLIAGLATPEGKGPVGRDLALDAAAAQKLPGEVAMLVLWTCADAGAVGPAMGDRIRMVRALHAVGLDADARAFALEGLLALK